MTSSARSRPCINSHGSHASVAAAAASRREEEEEKKEVEEAQETLTKKLRASLHLARRLSGWTAEARGCQRRA
jgi:hypothetical protein